jgi:hypothetical protein
MHTLPPEFYKSFPRCRMHRAYEIFQAHILTLNWIQHQRWRPFVPVQMSRPDLASEVLGSGVGAYKVGVEKVSHLIGMCTCVNIVNGESKDTR